MGTIKPLPENVRSCMRSGIILFDLTRVVEELVFNSLDAGATKVSVSVGVGTCYVKVMDDGCGISRDGLVLLGERYVTSKLHRLADMDAATVTFGYRGEALASISDVALLEIRTKARGRPNGYRKVLKGSKCLYFGVNDDRKDVGTTVVVRDLFYNQPVRRKCVQSSLKKVLDSVKKCILRIALVCSNVSFKVIDTESEDELLHTRPSSALSLLTSSFGIKDSRFLHELDVSNGILKLSGYISGPCDSLTVKAFQYVYINSRFVCKGPIHKLLDQLASKFECLDTWETNTVPQKGKRWKSQACPAYILNLSCPLALYHLTFETSKTYVDFKDVIPILNFIESSVQQLWTGKLNYDLMENHEFATNKRKTKKHKSSHYLYSPQFEMLSEEIDNSDYGKSEKIPFQEVSNALGFKGPSLDAEFLHHRSYSFQSWNSSISEHGPTMTQKGDCSLFATDDNSSFPDNYFLEDEVTTGKQRSIDHVGGHILALEWQNNSAELGSRELDESSEIAFSLDYDKWADDLDVSKKNGRPFLQSCSSRRNLPLVGSLFSSKEDPAYQRYEASYSRKFSTQSRRIDTCADFDSLSADTAKSFSFCEKPCAAEEGLGSSSAVLINNSGSGHHSLNSEWCSVTSDTFEATSWDVDYFGDDNRHEGRDTLNKNEKYRHFPCNQRKTCCYSCNVSSKFSSQDNFHSNCISTALDFEENNDTASALDFDDCALMSKDISEFFEGHNAPHRISLEHSNISFPETEWLPLDYCSRGSKSCKYDFNEICSNLQDWKEDKCPKGRSRRSQSAPPFYQQKRKFVSLSHHSTVKRGDTPDCLISPETDDVKHPYFQPNYVEDLMFHRRSNMKEVAEINNSEPLQDACYDNYPVEGLSPKGIHDSEDYGIKWRNGCQQIANNCTLSNIDNQQNVLDISSGFLHLAGNSLVPECLHKNCLEDSKVLQQVDKKFIPIVASGTLAIMDQHAADERIRLEELRQKVLSGEARRVTYLEAEKELILPEIGHQLLQNYAAQIRDWGWICNIQTHSSSFKRNLNMLHQQPTLVTLVAVPCILGVNLSDGDLLEFLQQLADTDGSSTMPQSVVRVLNFKACRGAIMFGDSLLPSECALIVEELKQTSLCFQCAHGRPTTAPLVNLHELHNQIAKLRLVDGSSDDVWHGLRRQELSLERASQRLRSARS